MFNISQLVTTYWKPLSIGLVVLVILGYVGVLKGQLTLARNNESEAITNLAQANSKLAVITAKITEQNAAIEELEKARAVQKAKADKAVKEFKIIKAQFDAAIKDINHVTYDPNISDCDNTRKLLDRVRTSMGRS